MILPPNTTHNDEERHAVLAAIGRLRNNTAERSNGAHTVVALAAESGVSRQRLYEHHSDLISDFKTAAGAGSIMPNMEAVQRQLARASERNQELLAENAALRDQITTLSAVITELTLDTSRMSTIQRSEPTSPRAPNPLRLARGARNGSQ